MAGAAAPKRIESQRDLIVWQKSMDLVVQVYQLTGAFPPSEIYRLVAQTTRAAASVPANIAEGHARSSRRDFANFLAIAKGSLMEAETFLMIVIRLEYLQKGAADSTLEPLLRSARC